MTVKKTERLFFVDWIRITLILTVFLFHIGMFFNSKNWSVKNNIQVSSLNEFMDFLHLWRMPFLFLISGIGTHFTLIRKKPLQYIFERTKRLLIPFISGIFILLPIQFYIENIYQYNSIFEVYMIFLNGEYFSKLGFNKYHLWFILFLYIMSILIYPLVVKIKLGKLNKVLVLLTNILYKKLNLIVPVYIIFIGAVNHLIPDIYWFSKYFFFFLTGFLFISNKKIMNYLQSARILFLTQALISIIIFYFTPNLFSETFIMKFYNKFFTSFIIWSIIFSSMGFSKEYLNINNKYRKNFNEGIYPFYLLHQPIIILIGHYIASIDINIFLKFLILTLSSFLTTIALYWFIIKKHKPLRVIFGLKV